MDICPYSKYDTLQFIYEEYDVGFVNTTALVRKHGSNAVQCMEKPITQGSSGMP